jgi:hypothetical protein
VLLLLLALLLVLRGDVEVVLDAVLLVNNGEIPTAMSSE